MVGSRRRYGIYVNVMLHFRISTQRNIIIDGMEKEPNSTDANQCSRRKT